MHNLEEMVHVAAWPTVRETYGIASRHYAFEGGCHVLAAGTLLHRDDLIEGLKEAGGSDEGLALIRQISDQQLQFGGSMIIGPDGFVIETAEDRDTILHADLDLTQTLEAKTALDVDGHYSRPDVFELSVNTDPRPGVKWD